MFCENCGKDLTHIKDSECRHYYDNSDPILPYGSYCLPCVNNPMVEFCKAVEAYEKDISKE